MGGEIGAPIGYLLATLAKAYLQGRGERQQAQSVRDVFGQMFDRMGGMDPGGAAAPAGAPFTEADLGTDSNAGPARSLRRTFVEQQPRRKLPGMDESGATQGPASSPFFRPMPAREPGLWGGIKGVGSDILEGFTPGSPYDVEEKIAMLSLKQAFEAAEERRRATEWFRRFGLTQQGLENRQAARDTAYDQRATQRATDAEKRADERERNTQRRFDQSQGAIESRFQRRPAPGSKETAPTLAQVQTKAAKLSAEWDALTDEQRTENQAELDFMVEAYNRTHPSQPLPGYETRTETTPKRFWPDTTEKKLRRKGGGGDVNIIRDKSGRLVPATP